MVRSLCTATESIRKWQLTCVHFFNLIELLYLKVPVAIGTTSLCKEDEVFCKHLIQNGAKWRINMFYVQVAGKEYQFSESQLDTSG